MRISFNYLFFFSRNGPVPLIHLIKNSILDSQKECCKLFYQFNLTRINLIPIYDIIKNYYFLFLQNVDLNNTRLDLDNGIVSPLQRWNNNTTMVAAYARYTFIKFKRAGFTQCNIHITVILMNVNTKQQIKIYNLDQINRDCTIYDNENKKKKENTKILNFRI